MQLIIYFNAGWIIPFANQRTAKERGDIGRCRTSLEYSLILRLISPFNSDSCSVGFAG